MKKNEEVRLERGRRVTAQPGSVLLLPAAREEERPALLKAAGASRHAPCLLPGCLTRL